MSQCGTEGEVQCGTEGVEKRERFHLCILFCAGYSVLQVMDGGYVNEHKTDLALGSAYPVIYKILHEAKNNNNIIIVGFECTPHEIISTLP